MSIQRFLILLFLSASILGAVAMTVMADSATGGIVGTWLVEDKDAKVEIAPCGDKLCGAIIWLEDPLDENGNPEIDDENPDPELRNQPILGLKILQGFDPEPNSGGLWTGGTVYDPNNGKTYKCQLSLENEETLKLRGYVGFSLLGRTSRWTRTAAPSASP